MITRMTFFIFLVLLLPPLLLLLLLLPSSVKREDITINDNDNDGQRSNDKTERIRLIRRKKVVGYICRYY